MKRTRLVPRFFFFFFLKDIKNIEKTQTKFREQEHNDVLYVFKNRF